MYRQKIYYCLILLILGTCSISCEKDFLEKKPDKALLIPETLQDMQALLDNHDVMNVIPALGIISADDLTTTDAGWLGYPTPVERNAFIWNEDIYKGFLNVGDWNTPYKQVFYSNIVLAGLAKLNPEKDGSGYALVKGSALFYRAQAFFQLAQLFCKPGNTPQDLASPGIPLKLSPEVEQKTSRGTVRQTYDQIINDLEAALPMLPEQSNIKSRPSKMATLALLSRIYLLLGDYDQALDFADEALKINSKLIDYNSLSVVAPQPFPIALSGQNDEVIWYGKVLTYTFTTSNATLVQPELLQLYHANDLRKQLYFITKGQTVNLKGKYSGLVFLFGGLTVSELFLIKSECLARTGQPDEAIDVLNNLLTKRWKTGTYQSLEAGNQDSALQLILQERRKELVGRGLRWSDLRRLNNEVDHDVTLKRALNGKEFSLLPNDKRYVLPIPQNEIDGSGIEQNAR